MMATMAVGGPGDPHTQMNTYRSYVTMLADSGAKDEIKLKAAQELSENFEVSTYVYLQSVFCSSKFDDLK